MRYPAINAHAAQAHADIKAMTQRALDEIAIKVGFYNRSAGQQRRYAKAKMEREK